MTEYVYKLKNGKVVSAYADEKGNISITKEALEIMVNSWNDGYEKGRKDAIEEYHLKLLNCQTTKVKNIYDAEIWVEFKRQSTNIAEELKEQNNAKP